MQPVKKGEGGTGEGGSEAESVSEAEAESESESEAESEALHLLNEGGRRVHRRRPRLLRHRLYNLIWKCLRTATVS